jgi:hypothetical protein
LVALAFPERQLQDSPSLINRGHCMRWAFTAYLMFQGVELWDIRSHAFVKVGNKFYDAERLMGERDWRDLPACNFGVSCGSSPAKHRHPDNFKRLWNTNYIKPDWRLYKRLANNFLTRYSHENF